MSAEKTPAVIADLDGTFRRFSLFADVMNVAGEMGIIDAPVINHKQSRIEDWLQALHDLLAGEPAEMFNPALRAQKLAVTNRLRTFRFVAPVLREARHQGFKIALVSRSPEAWVKAYAKTMLVRPDVVMGSNLHVEGGVFTGEVTPLDKAAATRQLAEMGYEAKLAFGDTGQDLPLLIAALNNGGLAVGVGFEDWHGDSLHVRAHGLGQDLTAAFINEDHDNVLEVCRGPLDSPRALGAFACSSEAITHGQLVTELGLA